MSVSLHCGTRERGFPRAAASCSRLTLSARWRLGLEDSGDGRELGQDVVAQLAHDGGLRLKKGETVELDPESTVLVTALGVGGSDGGGGRGGGAR